MKIPAASVPPPRCAPRSSREPPPPSSKPPHPTLGHQDRGKQGTRTRNPFSVRQDPDDMTEPARPCSASESVACEVLKPPPGLDSPAKVSRWPIWQFEKDPRKGKWMPMSNELSSHLEECYLLGFGETSFAVDGVHYYFDLKARSAAFDATWSDSMVAEWLEVRILTTPAHAVLLRPRMHYKQRCMSAFM